ncbi:hypothetical protein BsWGS_22153 [Bradybaena similaris]
MAMQYIFQQADIQLSRQIPGHGSVWINIPVFCGAPSLSTCLLWCSLSFYLSFVVPPILRTKNPDSSLLGGTSVPGCPECGLSLTLLSPLLKCTTHCVSVLTSTADMHHPLRHCVNIHC